MRITSSCNNTVTKYLYKQVDEKFALAVIATKMERMRRYQIAAVFPLESVELRSSKSCIAKRIMDLNRT